MATHAAFGLHSLSSRGTVSSCLEDSCYPCACCGGACRAPCRWPDKEAKPAEKPAGETAKDAAKPAEPKEELVKSEHSAIINGQKVEYTAVAGTLLLRDNEEKPTATIFYIAYTRNAVQT